MEIFPIIEKLAQNQYVFKALFADISVEQLHWKQTLEKWSLLEVACHLLDEEREDFRQRLDLTLHKPEETWPPIDPPAWVKDRKYSEQDFNKVLADFLNERTKSVGWLNNLKNPDWDRSYNHPKVGPVPAKLILINWLAHDYLHIRQITRMNYLYLKEKSAPTKLDYAGEW